MVLSRGLMRLTPARAAELRRRIKALDDEFGEDGDPDGEAYGLVFAVYPDAAPGRGRRRRARRDGNRDGRGGIR